MTLLTAAQRQILEDIASRKTTGWQEAPDVFGDHQMLYEARLIDGANASADDGFGLLDMRLTMAGQQALASSPEAVRVSRDGVHTPVVRPFWKRWGFWSKLVVAVAGCITFAITVWPVVKEVLKLS